MNFLKTRKNSTPFNVLLVRFTDKASAQNYREIRVVREQSDPETTERVTTSLHPSCHALTRPSHTRHVRAE